MARSEIDPAVVDELADRVGEVIVRRVVDALKAEGVISSVAEHQKWLSAKEVAQRLGVSRAWVYEHADELQAARIGHGPRARLRFPPGMPHERVHDQAGPPSEPVVQRTGLIPIHPS